MPNTNESDMLHFFEAEKTRTGYPASVVDTWNEASKVAETKIRAASNSQQVIQPITAEMANMADGIMGWTPAGVAAKLKSWLQVLNAVVDPKPAEPVAEPVQPER